jgi:tRNA(Ile)-lysidine synthase
VTDLLQSVEREIQNRLLFKRGDKILVAVSGGVDSMVLVHALKMLSAEHKWKISVAHFNHQLRGSASDADERLVRNTSASLKLTYVASRADVQSFARQSKLSIEMSARKLRHEFFAATAKKNKIRTVALAHHVDDQVELFFLRLLRGAGGEGLGGMKWKSPSPADKAISLVRPLLKFSKVELTGFARESKIRFRNDATNFTNDLLRNRIRNELLPLLRKNYQPSLNKTILRVMEIVGAESDFVGEAGRKWLAGPSRAFEKMPIAIQRRVLQLQLARLGVAADFDLVTRLRDLENRAISVSPNLSVLRNRAGAVELRLQSSIEFNVNTLEGDLGGRAGRIKFGGQEFRWMKNNFAGSRRHSPHLSRHEFFDADKIGDKIFLRHWHPGDRFQPIGRKSSVKLQDLFTNAKIPREQRHKSIVAEAAGGEIFWVEGLRIGERFKLTPKTRRKLVWCWRKSAV